MDNDNVDLISILQGNCLMQLLHSVIHYLLSVSMNPVFCPLLFPPMLERKTIYQSKLSHTPDCLVGKPNSQAQTDRQTDR
ncbi:uncharacterized protein BO97DRAFT_185196 [Aspergillus homomorphus CBS 101889]|uniref:Uncharacterized protein n=1 Tax=Aspergillus homomorphus (strain CBS 101889) TaxID=1450537 RepID=A0A395HMS0_ASPHC|nr:hypothetical protein BO97DRAFT_185196 [Aspergillus homomorphus CBS 101889]RAL09137.1 hypothetical protein BO97DRAFT_185196 [Aspergillus homomorphus CBS 101889]